MQRKIQAKYESKCKSCKKAIAIGDFIWWHKGEKGVCCYDCGSPTPQKQEQSDALAIIVELKEDINLLYQKLSSLEKAFSKQESEQIPY